MRVCVCACGGAHRKGTKKKSEKMRVASTAMTNSKKCRVEEEEEDSDLEEDLFVFNDIIEGPRAPAVKPGRVVLYYKENHKVKWAIMEASSSTPVVERSIVGRILPRALAQSELPQTLSKPRSHAHLRRKLGAHAIVARSCSEGQLPLCIRRARTRSLCIHTHTHDAQHTYIYIYMCVCVCV